MLRIMEIIVSKNFCAINGWNKFTDFYCLSIMQLQRIYVCKQIYSSLSLKINNSVSKADLYHDQEEKDGDSMHFQYFLTC